jgi:hypothetical protein
MSLIHTKRSGDRHLVQLFLSDETFKKFTEARLSYKKKGYTSDTFILLLLSDHEEMEKQREFRSPGKTW